MAELTFLDKLAQLRSTNCEDLPTPEYAVLSRTVERLRRINFHEHCLQIGETVPDFEWIDPDEHHCSLYEVLATGPVVLNFFRGYWCPYCKTEVEAYDNIQTVLAELGASYFAISPQRPETATARPKSYQVIFDQDNRIAHDFRIVYALEQSERDLFQSWGLNLDEVNGSSKWELPVPATFVICQDRRIGFQFVDVDFRARCCPEELIEELKSSIS
ncbi:MAG: peroxiredoxin [Candidatus Azotimanducaceae bacterium]|jgi:peroxiredoxin